MYKIPEKQKVFYGSTTIGQKGQAVIPSEARKAMKLHKGEKMLVFGMGSTMLVLAKFSQLQEIAKHLSDQLKGVQKIMKGTKKTK